MSAVFAIRRKLVSLAAEAAALEGRLLVINPGYQWDPKIRAADRIVAVLARDPGMTLTAAELLEATGCMEDALRRALTILVSQGRIERESHGRYHGIEAREQAP